MFKNVDKIKKRWIKTLIIFTIPFTMMQVGLGHVSEEMSPFSSVEEQLHMQLNVSMRLLLQFLSRMSVLSLSWDIS